MKDKHQLKPRQASSTDSGHITIRQISFSNSGNVYLTRWKINSSNAGHTKVSLMQ